MNPTDIQIVREALEHGLKLWDDEPDVFSKAIEAFNRIIERTLPELPQGWEYTLYQVGDIHRCELDHEKKENCSGEGKSPREAVINALEMVK